MELTDITSYAMTTLLGIEGIADEARIYDLVRNSNNETEFKQTFVKGGTINAWLITREGFVGADGPGTGETTETHQIVIRGYLSYKEGVTEPNAQAILTRVCRRFNRVSTRIFHSDVEWSGPMNGQIYVGPFSGAMCHLIRLQWPVVTTGE